MVRLVVLALMLFFGAFGAQAQEDSNQIDPTNCSGQLMFIQGGEVWEIAHPGWEPSFLWGSNVVQVECLGAHLLTLINQSGEYMLYAPTTNEYVLQGFFVQVRPDGMLFEVSGNVLWFSGASDNEQGVWGLFRDEEEWFLISPIQSWRLPTPIVGVTVNDDWVLEAVETSEGVWWLNGFDIFVEGAHALHEGVALCASYGEGCIADWNFRNAGVPEDVQIVDFAQSGPFHSDILLEIERGSGAHEIWAFDPETQSFAPVGAE